MPTPLLLPQDPVADALSVAGVVQLCDNALARAQTIVENLRKLESVSDDVLSWDVTFGAFDRMAFAVQEAACVPGLLTVAHADPTVRNAAATCEPKVDAFVTLLYMDDAVANVLKRAAKHIDVSTDPVRARFIEHTLRDYRRNGLDLEPTGREHLRKLNEEITAAGQAFEKNLAEATLSIEIKPEQLDGLPEPYRASHPVQSNGLVGITTDYPDLVPFMRYAKDRTAARELYRVSQNRAREKNLPLLDQLIRLRQEKTKLLGYATWADYVVEPRMAKNAAAVKAFLDDLHVGLMPIRDREFKLYQALAQTLGLSPDGNVSASDAAYLEDLLCQQQFALDSQALSEYFEVRAVERGIMEITSALYNVTFKPVEAPVWHPEVRPFDVLNQDQTVLGRVYLDLYPREGKYKHAAVFGLRETLIKPDGSRQMPIGALVCNFPRPGDSPALLTHSDVTTFFHEFGHLLHHVFSTSTYASFAGTNVARDFVEAPSQMFEDWAWQRETLDRFARHHATNEPLPDALLQALHASRTFGEGIRNERQIFLAALDQAYHTGEPGLDTTRVMEDMHAEYSPFTRVPDTYFQATFGHLVGYDAAYYGYQWARSLSFDLLTRFTSEGMMNTKVAQDYRAAILEPGGSRDESAMVETFLGRPSNAEAYKMFLGFGK